MKIKVFEFNPFGENTYLLYDETSKEGAVIDPGMMSEAECQKFSEVVDREGITIRYCIATHIHIDHIAGVNYIEEKYGVGLSASAQDAFLSERIEQQARMFHLPGDFSTPVKIAHILKEGDTLELGSEILEVVEVPGHSPGSIAIYIPESNCILTGDALFKRSIGRTDLPGGDFQQLLESIRTKLMILKPDTLVLPGHGPSTTIRDELRLNPFVR